jgi:hypothetical protein
MRTVKILRRDFHRDYSSRKGGRDTKYIWKTLIWSQFVKRSFI